MIKSLGQLSIEPNSSCWPQNIRWFWCGQCTVFLLLKGKDRRTAWSVFGMFLYLWLYSVLEGSLWSVWDTLWEFQGGISVVGWGWCIECGCRELVVIGHRLHIVLWLWLLTGVYWFCFWRQESCQIGCCCGMSSIWTVLSMWLRISWLVVVGTGAMHWWGGCKKLSQPMLCWVVAKACDKDPTWLDASSRVPVLLSQVMSYLSVIQLFLSSWLTLQLIRMM